MTSTPLFPEGPTDTREAIMAATYRALCEHGYANLTIDRIGREFAKSKSLLYHHYDGKDDLLLDFLEFLLERFEATVPLADADGAAERLERLFDHLLSPAPAADREEFMHAMIELRAQAAHDAAYRAQFTRTDDLFRDRTAAIVRQGVEQGTFRDVDPEQVASFLHATLDGAMLERVTTDDFDAAALRAELDVYVESRLLPAEA